VEVGRELFRLIKEACSGLGLGPGLLAKRVYIERSITTCTAVPTAVRSRAESDFELL